MDWATFWATFLQTHLVTLLEAHDFTFSPQGQVIQYIKSRSHRMICERTSNLRQNQSLTPPPIHQGCQMVYFHTKIG
jgi:hypothetical protein